MLLIEGLQGYYLEELNNNKTVRSRTENKYFSV